MRFMLMMNVPRGTGDYQIGGSAGRAGRPRRARWAGSTTRVIASHPLPNLLYHAKLIPEPGTRGS